MLNILKETSYSGRYSYKRIEALIRGARALYIVSPYLDAYYARFLLRNSRKKSVYLLSSAIEGSAYKILRKRYFNKDLLYLLLIAIAANFMLYLTGTFLLIGIFIALLLLLAFLLTIRKGERNIHVKIPNEFVHAKMYISDSHAIVGSANLTYRGTHANVEHIEIIYDRERLKNLKDEFFRMWQRYK